MSNPKPDTAEQAFAVDSPGSEPQSLHLILSQFAAQFRDLSAMARTVQEGKAIVALESEVNALQNAIDKVRSARDSIGIVLRSMAYTKEDAKSKQSALDLLLDSLEKAIGVDGDTKAADVLAALRKGGA